MQITYFFLKFIFRFLFENERDIERDRDSG